MEVHNYFTARVGGREATAFNTAFSIMPFIKTNTPYARYIALGDGGVAGGKLASVKYIAPVTLMDINSDVSKGVLRAEYGVMVENVAAFAFSEFALCANIDGSGVVSHATCALTKFEGEEMSVSSTIFITFSGEAHLVGGDNPLARLMLGQKAMNGEYRICTGDCFFPNLDINRGKSLYVNSVVVTPVFDDTSVTFSGNLYGDKAELLLTLDGQPILRCLSDFTSEINTYMTPGSISGGFACPERFTKDVFNVSQNGAQITNYYLWRRCQNIANIISPINFLVGQVSGIKNDPQQQYIAVTTQKEVVLLKFDETSVKIVLRAPYSGEYVEACVGGRLALWGDAKLKIYEPGDAYVMTEYAVGKGTQNAVVYEGGGLYHAGRILNGYIERFKIGKGVVGGFEQFYVLPASPGQVLARDFSYIAYFGFGCPIGVTTANGYNSLIEGNLDRIFKATGEPTIMKIGEGIMYVDTPKMKNTVITYNSAKLMRLPADEKTLVSGNIFMRNMQNTVREIYMIDNGYITIASAGQLPKIEKELKAIANASGWMVVLYEDGSIEAKYMSGDITIVASPDILPKVDVSYSARIKKVPYQYNTNLVTMKLEYAP